MQTTRRKIVEKSLSQKVFLLTIFHSKTKSFFIYFEKYFFHFILHGKDDQLAILLLQCLCQVRLIDLIFQQELYFSLV